MAALRHTAQLQRKLGWTSLIVGEYYGCKAKLRAKFGTFKGSSQPGSGKNKLQAQKCKKSPKLQSAT
jgi:hypothetical protein